MSEQKKMVIIGSRGLDDERATVTFTLANAGLAEGMDMTVFLVSNGADLARKGAVDHIQMNPLDPSLKELVEGFRDNGGKILVCPPCAKVRGYEPENLMDGAEIAGAPALYGLIQDGAATLSL